MTLIDIRCFNHNQREAAARCPECGNYFCRECITEHREKMLCAQCIQKNYKELLKRRSFMVLAAQLFQGIAGFILLWLLFYFLGFILLKIPTSFHEGAIWEQYLN